MILENANPNFNIVLLEPEIPYNTGNIARTCLCTNSTLHLIEPLGFVLDSKRIKRAGLDYWDKVDVRRYSSVEDFFEKNPIAKTRCFFATTKSRKTHCDVSFKKGDFIMFGKESKGLPEEMLVDNEKNCIRIPMHANNRSLNLSNSVAICLYEALRQNDFLDLNTKGNLHNLEWK